MSASTKRSLRVHNRYFNKLMAHLNQLRVSTIEKALQLVADMQLHKYSTRDITKVVYSLQCHPRVDIRARFLSRHPKIKNAIKNLKGMQVITEDTRTIMVPTIVEEFAEVADHDFPLKMAITMKAMLSIGMRWQVVQMIQVVSPEIISSCTRTKMA